MEERDHHGERVGRGRRLEAAAEREGERDGVRVCVCARATARYERGRVGELSWVPGENHRGTLHLTRPMRTYVTWMSIRIYERRYVHV